MPDLLIEVGGVLCCMAALALAQTIPALVKYSRACAGNSRALNFAFQFWGSRDRARC